jgi:coenzyme F420 biosynthesis associated uncharacterized protein
VPPVLSAMPPGTIGSGIRPSTSEGTGAISWDVAQRVAEWVGRRSPLPAPYRPDLLQAHFAEVTAEAEELVESATGLRSTAGTARAVVTDRPGWVAANIAAFQRLVGPHLERLSARQAGARLGLDPRWTRSLTAAGRLATGAQMGTILGWLSTRVLGQYDVLVVDEAPEEQDVVYFVGPNVVALEREHGFEPRQFRLWLALHEVTHRCQFTAVPWMREYFVSLVDTGLASLGPDPARFAEAVRRLTDEVLAGRNPLREHGALGLVATPEQLDGLRRIQALMSLLEGHGDVTMGRAGAAAVPAASEFAAALRHRRNQARGPARLLQQLVGLEAKLRQYEDGARFVTAVEASGGPELFGRVWTGPEWLPSLGELRDPDRWIARVRPAATH